MNIVSTIAFWIGVGQYSYSVLSIYVTKIGIRTGYIKGINPSSMDIADHGKSVVILSMIVALVAWRLGQ